MITPQILKEIEDWATFVQSFAEPKQVFEGILTLCKNARSPVLISERQPREDETDDGGDVLAFSSETGWVRTHSSKLWSSTIFSHWMSFPPDP